jgi:hypothetical protein
MFILQILRKVEVFVLGLLDEWDVFRATRTEIAVSIGISFRPLCLIWN